MESEKHPNGEEYPLAHRVGSKDFTSWFVIAALAARKLTPDEESAVRNKPSRLRLTLNGVDLPVERSLTRLEEQFDMLVAEEAAKLIDRMFGSITEDLDRARKAMLGEIKQRFPQARISDSDW